jgi:hypothetical protein
VWVLHRAVTVNYSCGHDRWIVGVGAADGDGLAEEVNVAVAVAGVSAWLDYYGVAFVGVVYCGLDVVEIGGAVVVNGYDSAGGRGCCRQVEH